jgi:DNA-binding transcriptional MerR regulator
VSGERDEPIYSIGAVARMLDVPASTLRAWEDRYSLITPNRSEGSQRLYSRAQVERLRFVKSQIESGLSAADAHRLLSEELRAGSLPVQIADHPEDRRPLVLIADRDPYAADLAEYFLRTEGYEVIVAADATQAKLNFQERSPDLVLIDLLLSGGAGFRLLTEFAASKTSHIVAVAAIDSADEAMRLGAGAFLRKPLEPLALVSTARDMLGSSALVRPSHKSRAPR